MSTPQGPVGGVPTHPTSAPGGWVAPGSAAPDSGAGPQGFPPAWPSAHAAPPGTPYSAPPGTPYNAPPGATPYSTPPGANPYSAPGANPYGAPPGAPPYAGSPGSNPYQAAAVGAYPGQPTPVTGGAVVRGQYWNAFKPGVVSLRPMSLGDVFGGSFALLRFNPKATMGLTGIAVVLGVALAIPLTLLSARTLDEADGAEADALTLYFGAMMFGSLPGLLTNLLVAPLLIRVTYEAIIGNQASIADAWTTTRSRILPYIGATIVTAVMLGLVPVASTVLMIALAANSDTQSVGIVLSLFAVIMIASTAAVVWLAIKLFALPAAIVLEGSGVFASIRRSWELTKGSFWRILGYLILGGLAAALIRYAIQVPVSLLLLVLGTAWTDTAQGELFVATVSQVGGQLLGVVITVPFLTAFTTLLWADLRIRREGFDLALIEQSENVEQSSDRAAGTR